METNLHQNVDEVRDSVAFVQLLENRITLNLAARIDTIPCEYIFLIEEFSFLDSVITVKEEYFNVGDSIPSSIFVNDELIDVFSIYTSIFGREKMRIRAEELFIPKLKKYQAFQSFQELAYAKEQVREHGCVDPGNDGIEFRKRRSNELRNTYAIYTLIEKSSKTVFSSFQYAPKEPTFEIVHYAPVWDF